MTTLKLTVKTDRITERSGIAKASGKPYNMRIQEDVYLHLDDIETRRIQFTIPDDASPYAPGVYQVDFNKIIDVNEKGTPILKRFAPLPIVTASHITKAA